MPLVGCQKVPQHQPWEYITWSPGVNNSRTDLRQYKPRISDRLRDHRSVGTGDCSVPRSEFKPVPKDLSRRHTIRPR